MKPDARAWYLLVLCLVCSVLAASLYLRQIRNDVEGVNERLEGYETYWQVKDHELRCSLEILVKMNRNTHDKWNDCVNLSVYRGRR